jgi:uncharacterized membrane protein YgcG
MNHKWNTFNRCECCGILKSTANAMQACVSKNENDSYDDGLVSAATMATFTSLFESSDTSSSSDDFNAGGGDFGGGGSSSDW